MTLTTRLGEHLPEHDEKPDDTAKATFVAIGLAILVPLAWTFTWTFLRFTLFDRNHHVWPSFKRIVLIFLSAFLEAAGVSVLFLVVAARVHALGVLALTSCIFWLPRQELLAWIRTLMGWESFYDEDREALINEEWSTVQGADDARSDVLSSAFAASDLFKRKSFYKRHLENPLAVVGCILQLLLMGAIPFWLWWTTDMHQDDRDDYIIYAAPVALLAISIAWWPALQNQITSRSVGAGGGCMSKAGGSLWTRQKNAVCGRSTPPCPSGLVRHSFPSSSSSTSLSLLPSLLPSIW